MISIIVPVYNTAPYLRSCLDSILSQSYCDWELILIDDESTDGSEQICDEYGLKDARIHVIHQKNGGPAVARNQGLSHASGDTITFVDSDDLLHSQFLEILLHVMRQRKADVVLTEVNLSKRIPFTEPVLPLDYKILEYTGHEAIEQMLYQRRVHSAPFKLYRRSVLNDKAFPEQYMIYEDLYAMLDIFAISKKVCVIDLPLYFYFKRQNGTLNTWSMRNNDALEVMKHVRSWVKKYDDTLLPAVNSREISLSFNLLCLNKNNASHDTLMLKECCWQIIHRYRIQSLFDPKTRLKNKCALLLSFLKFW